MLAVPDDGEGWRGRKHFANDTAPLTTYLRTRYIQTFGIDVGESCRGGKILRFTSSYAVRSYLAKLWRLCHNHVSIQKSVAATLGFAPTSCHKIVIRLKARLMSRSSIHEHLTLRMDSPLPSVQSKPSAVWVTPQSQGWLKRSAAAPIS